MLGAKLTRERWRRLEWSPDVWRDIMIALLAGGVAWLLANGLNTWENVWIPITGAVIGVLVYEAGRLMYGFVWTVPNAMYVESLRDGAAREQQVRQLQSEIAALKADPPVVLLEFTSDSMFRPSVINAINGANGPTEQIKNIELTVRATRGNVLNVHFGLVQTPEVTVSFGNLVTVGQAPVKLKLYSVLTSRDGDITMQDTEQSLSGLFEIIASGEMLVWKRTTLSIFYSTPGRDYVTDIGIYALPDGVGHARVNTQWEDTREIRRRAVLTQAP